MELAGIFDCNIRVACAILINASFLTLISCREEYPRFSERIIDDQAPEHLWMKTIGDINQDGKADLLVGGWQSGGLVAYLAADWKKQTINDSLCIRNNSPTRVPGEMGLRDMQILAAIYESAATGNRVELHLEGFQKLIEL